jgi:hypothetical protein
MRILHLFGSALAIVLIGSVAFAQATLATVRIGHAVLLNGNSVPPGTYQIRLTDDVATPAVGQSPRAEQWVEFLKGGQVVGRELASVIGAGEPSPITARPRGTTGTIKTDSARVELLKGGEYVQVRITRNGEHYIINAPLVR